MMHFKKEIWKLFKCMLPLFLLMFIDFYTIQPETEATLGNTCLYPLAIIFNLLMVVAFIKSVRRYNREHNEEYF
jgi:hypothetical protein